MKASSYYADESDRLDAVRDIVRHFPRFEGALKQLWWGGDPIRLRLRCPHGHGLRVLEVDVDLLHSGGGLLPVVSVVPGTRDRAPALVDAAPGSSARRLCETPGCPSLVEAQGGCSEHGGPTNCLGWVTDLRCRARGCTYGASIRLEDLVRLIGLAVEYDTGQIVLPG